VRRPPVHPAWNWVEIAAISAIYLAALWILGPRLATGRVAAGAFWALAIAGFAYALWLSPRWHRDPPAWRGWGGPAPDGGRPGAFRAAWPGYAAATLGMAVALLAVTAWLKPGSFADLRWKAIAVKLATYVFFGIVQGMYFFGFLMSRLRGALPAADGPGGAARHRSVVALATAGIFALYHAPNAPLMGVALPAGFAWAWLYYRRPNLLLHGISHAVVGTLLNRVVQLHMRVGPFYERPDLYVLRTVIPGVRRLIGDLY